MLKYKHSILCGNDDKLVGRREILKVLLQNWWTDVLCLFWSLVQHTGTGWRSHRAINRVVVIWLWSSKVKWPKRSEPKPILQSFEFWRPKIDWNSLLRHICPFAMTFINCTFYDWWSAATLDSPFHHPTGWLAGWQIHLDIDVHLDGLPPYCRLRQLRKVI